MMITTRKAPSVPYKLFLKKFHHDPNVVELSEFWTTSFEARFEPGGRRIYKCLTEEYFHAAQEVFDDMRKESYRPWYLMLGRAHSREAFQAKYPNFSLLQYAQKRFNFNCAFRELRLETEEFIQNVAIFETEWDMLASVINNRTSLWGDLIIFSKREITSDLESIKQCGGTPLWFDFPDPGHSHVNWHEIAALLCPLGDIVGRPWGAFDDRERSINLIYKRDAITSSILCSLQRAQEDRSDGRTDE
jgi:hypothetical protein